MKFVATFDPRLNGGVVVESHAAGVKVGDIIEIPNDIVSLTK
jgi:CRISPR-associated Csx3 family protein